MNSELGIPSRMRDIIKPEKIGDFADSEATQLKLAEKAAANPTGFTNALPFNVDDYMGIIQQAK